MNEFLVAVAVVLSMAGQQAGGSPQQAGGSPQQTAAATLPEAPQQQQQQTTQQQQQIPDAPKPNVTGIGPVAPGVGTTQTSGSNSNTVTNAPEGTSTVPGAADEAAPGTSLPTVQTQRPGSGAEDNAPDVAPEIGGATFTLPSLRTNFVEVPFTVKDNKNHLVPGLTWRDVRVYENGVRQHMTNFTVDPFPLSVAVVIDQSLPQDVMTRVNNALGALQGAFTPYDEVAVFTYNNGPRLQTDFTGGQSARLQAVVERSKSDGRDFSYYSSGGLSQGINLNNGAQANLTPLSQSSGVGSPHGVDQVQREVHTLNDAILMAAIAESKVAQGRRRIIFVITDGKEYGSTAKTKDVIKYLQTNKIAVYGTLVGDAAVTGAGFIDRVHLPLTMRDNNLSTFTAATGGETYAEYRTKGIEMSFPRITEDVRTQYTVGYYSREPLLDGKYRKLEIRVLRPSLTVVAKDGYYPSASAAGGRQLPSRPVAEQLPPNQ